MHRNESRNVRLPGFQARPIAENKNEGLESLVFHVDCQAEFATRTGISDLFDVSNINSTLQFQDTLS